jgi:hypothetical protein
LLSRINKKNCFKYWQPDRSIISRMKPAPAPEVPGNTESERMGNALRMVLTVSKKDLLRKEARMKRASEKKRAGKGAKA